MSCDNCEIQYDCSEIQETEYGSYCEQCGGDYE